MTFVNAEVKQQASMRGVKLYELPEKLGVSESTFYRLRPWRLRVLEFVLRIPDDKPDALAYA